MIQQFVVLARHAERLHRRHLALVERELRRSGFTDLEPIQALMLANIGSDEITIGELTARGYYPGANPTYSVQKLTRQGYVAVNPHLDDGRSRLVRLTEKGQAVAQLLAELQVRESAALAEAIGLEELAAATAILARVESRWAGTSVASGAA